MGHATYGSWTADPAGAMPRRAALAVAPATVLTFCAVFSLVLFLPAVLNDTDTLWQIRAGQWILDHRAIPDTDPFSFTAGGRLWLAHEWLAETLMGLAYRAGGMPGVMALTAGAVGLTAGILLYYLRRWLPGRYALLGLVIALGNAAPSLLARPHVLAWPCLVVWCGALADARARRAAPSLALLPVMLLWVNLHGSFMVGLVLAALFLVEAWFEPAADRRRMLSSWSSFTLAAWLVALLNPDLLSGVLFPLRHVEMHSLARIGEWQPTDFGRPQPLEVIILAGLALGLSGKVTLPPVRLLILVGLIHAALSHARHEQLLGLVGALVLAEPLAGRLGFQRRHLPCPGMRRAGVILGALAVAALALTVRVLLPMPPERTGAAFAAVLDRVPPALRTQPVLNEYGLGGALIFQGVHPFIDSRADLYGDDFLQRYARIIAPDRAELERALSTYRITWAVFRCGDPVVGLLDQEPGWHRIAQGDGVVIQAREGSY